MSINLNQAVITTSDIIKGKKNILTISHDEDNGMWQFVDGETEDYKIVALQKILDIDPSIYDILDLPLGFIAYRENIQAEWIIQKNEYDEE